MMTFSTARERPPPLRESRIEARGSRAISMDMASTSIAMAANMKETGALVCVMDPANLCGRTKRSIPGLGWPISATAAASTSGLTGAGSSWAVVLDLGCLLAFAWALAGTHPGFGEAIISHLSLHFS